jgi:hypothetical protein
MARERKYEKDKQTHFAKTHQRVMKHHYMTDIDSIQIVDTENQMYHQYTYKNGTPIVRRIIEVKSQSSTYLQNILSGMKPPSQQMIVQSNTVAELNAFRKQQGMPLAQYVIVIQDYNKFPYNIWHCDTSFGSGKLNFEHRGKVECDEEFEAYFTTSIV